ncbi:hypothetical protein CEP54_000194 [Fusarium duplospermum]|uniref:Uncharacterized protein n=1 Tax=Fusarium duplospermum TaxID=1325734 RepID=A0A428R817_9HYPO|nr:hypothetical protein CEP54_000194 [Fusarium duplospermum]
MNRLALPTLGGAEGLERSSRVDRENGPYLSAITKTPPLRCSTNGDLRMVERPALDSTLWNRKVDTNEPKASPEPSFLRIPRLKPPNHPPKLFEVRRLDKTCVVSVNDILVGDLLFLKGKATEKPTRAKSLGPANGTTLQRGWFMMRSLASAVSGVLTDHCNQIGTSPVNYPATSRDEMALSASSPEALILKGIVQGFTHTTGLLCGLFNIVPSLWHLLCVPAKSGRSAKNALETISKIDFETYSTLFIPLVLMIPTYLNPNSKIGSTDSLPLSFLGVAIFILQHRRRLKPLLDQILSSYQSVVSNSKIPPSINAGHRRQSHWKSALTLLALFHGIPVIAIAWAPKRALRIASGVTASGTAAAVIPLRTIDDVPSWAWVSDYTVWMICFAAYLTLQIHHIPCRGDHRRQLYLFLVILLAIHFAIALAQSSPTLIDGFTIFGPMVLTVTTFLVALLFGAIPAMETRGDGGGTEENTTGTSPHPAGIGMAVLNMCG